MINQCSLKKKIDTEVIREIEKVQRKDTLWKERALYKSRYKMDAFHKKEGLGGDENEKLTLSE